MRYLLIFMFLVGIFVVGKRSFNFSFGGTKGTGPMKTETRSARELTTLADTELRRELEGVAGVGQVSLVGAEKRAVGVEEEVSKN